ncbi:MAG: hypothetical protein ACOH5I_14890 [Oligoflexus sp.]
MSRFTWPRMILGLVGVLCFHLELLGNDRQVPVIRQVGVIPVQWYGEISPVSDLARSRLLIDSGFSDLVRSAKRFQILNDEITRELWDSADGRRRLTEDFEMDALLSLSIQMGEDLQVWSLRLLSPRLDNYLIESERIPISWFYQASDQEITERLRRLTYRLLNRYPIDVFVTSVQGRFLTLSAGKEQNLFEGQTLTFHRFRIASLHPANDAWLSYDTAKLGEAKIIDTKNHSSVAQMTSLSYEGAIRVGDGARVDHIASRQLFARLTDEDEVYRREAAASAIIGPRELVKPAPKAPQKKPEFDLPQLPPVEDRPTAEPERPREEQESTAPSLPAEVYPGPNDEDGLAKWMTEHVKEVRVLGGIDMWSYNQSRISAKSSFPLWLVNRAEAHARLQWDADTYSEANGLLGLGLTGSGNYFGFGLGMNWIRQISAPGAVVQNMDGFELGVQSQFRSLTVSGENFGGIDVIELGGLARIYGQHHIIETSQTIEYRAGLDVSVMSWGQVGLAGLKKSVSGIFAYGMNIEGVLKGSPDQWDIGGFIKVRSGSYDDQLGNLGFNSIYFGLLGRKHL